MKENIDMLSLLKNKKGNISILALLLINIILFQIIYTQSYMLELKLYNKHNVENKKFILENLIIKMIYENKNKVNYKSKNLVIDSIVKEKKKEFEIEIKVTFNKEILNYYVLFDEECERILQFYLQNKKEIV